MMETYWFFGIFSNEIHFSLIHQLPNKFCEQVDTVNPIISRKV